MARVWQIAGGTRTRSYSESFLNYGVGLIGPGDPGEYKDDRPDAVYGGQSYVRRFATLPQVGDVFVLRCGKWDIRAVGIVAKGYEYLDEFDDVNGWDLQHARRVRWCPNSQRNFTRCVFGTRPDRFSEVSDQEVLQFVHEMIASQTADWKTADLPKLPAKEPALEAQTLPPCLASVVALANSYSQKDFGARVSEDEIIVHLVVPFFRSLGWQQEQIAVKWRKVDVALFGRLPRTPKNCRCIVEAKYAGAGIEGALTQGRGYAQALSISPPILVTDGFRYRLYAGDQGSAHIAYANLLRLKQPAKRLFEHSQP
jgi:hypothetical protein